MSSEKDPSTSESDAFVGSEVGVNDPATMQEPSDRRSAVNSVGQLLRETRETHGLSVPDVARALKLSLNQVEALETDDWSSLPGKTIIRGFVRNYARLLGLDSNQLMGELDRLVLPQTPELRMSAGTPVKFSQETKTEQRDYLRVFSGVIILILAILAYFLLPPDIWKSTLEAIKNAAQSHKVVVEKEGQATIVEPESIVLPLETNFVPDNEVAVIDNPLAPTVTPALDSESNPPQELASEPTTEAEPVVEVVPPPIEDVSLDFSFNQAAWLEVRDRSGKVIFSQLNQAGSQQIVQGEPPYSLVIGNAGHVTLRYKGEMVDLSKRSKDDVARLTLE